MSQPSDQTESGEITDEAALVVGLQRGDPIVFGSLVRQYGARMLALARRYMGDEDDAREVVQETFLRAFRASQGFRGDATPLTWLRHIAANTALMHLRRKRRRKEVSLDSLLPLFNAQGYRLGADRAFRTPDLITEELSGVLRELVASLPMKYREIVVLRDIAGVGVAEVSELLGVSSSVVNTRLHRARQALRELYRRHFERGDR